MTATGQLDAGATVHFVVTFEHLGQRLPVPELLERPHRQERRDLGILVSRRDQQVTHVADRVVLDVVGVAKTAQHVVIEWSTHEVVVVDVAIVERSDVGQVAIDVETHSEWFEQ